MTVTVQLHRAWDEVLMQTADFRPAGSAAVLLGFTAERWPEDGGLPAALAGALAAAFCRLGVVAARWFEDAPPVGAARFLPARRPDLLRAALEGIRHATEADLVLTRDAAVAALGFETGWPMQYQMLLVLGAGAAECEPALAALRARRQWRDFVWPAALLALCAPGVDGDVAMIAAPDPDGLAMVVAAVEGALAAAGLGKEEVMF